MIPLQNILFVDIETVPQTRYWEDLDETMQDLFSKKTSFLRNKEEVEISSEDYYHDHAGIWAEFGKIICISCGFIVEGNLRIKSFFGSSEHLILRDFCTLLNDHYNQKTNALCAHNGNEFDIPYICRRLIINSLPLPNVLDLSGKKPWEVQHIDTLQLWKFGDYKYYTSLDLLANILNITVPKTDMNGSKVASTYYNENDIDKIVAYCERDVFTVAQVYLKIKILPAIKEIVK